MLYRLNNIVIKRANVHVRLSRILGYYELIILSNMKIINISL